MPTFESIMEGRVNAHNYGIFCEKFVHGIIGNQVFKNGCCTEHFSNFVTVSDEAMTLLILNNNWNVWLEIAEAKTAGENKAQKDCSAKQKYFDEKKGRGYSWNDAGKLFFNEVYDMIVKDREDHAEVFDEAFLAAMLSASGDKVTTNKRKQLPVAAKVVIKCRRDTISTSAIGIKKKARTALQERDVVRHEFARQPMPDCLIEQHRKDEELMQRMNEQATRLIQENFRQASMVQEAKANGAYCELEHDGNS
jgi:hypothetical protein